LIAYEATKDEFLRDVFDDELVNNIVSNYNSKIGRDNEREVRSWDNSMGLRDGSLVPFGSRNKVGWCLYNQREA
jgi:hypothetical protein